MLLKRGRETVSKESHRITERVQESETLHTSMICKGSLRPNSTVVVCECQKLSISGVQYETHSTNVP